ncbi:Uncharacterised protein [Pseudomonas aeruginosa]|uniref:hypothetical protein n=1 Tax=Pseudomonas aeruginosa TaxID=287 RepID=UPI0007176CCD|nr:hypothetical protein [Pseudomonas aeruginosa]KRV02466.1 hypothetical protein AN455_11110 [Pseudomonas aeruginosa]KRV08273.1 hypothetical protein AN456_11940 [Pseudomonas aeruginosa]SQC54703.1 Uncharacterised protein [Pseudomonas aeruginosa]
MHTKDTVKAIGATIATILIGLFLFWLGGWDIAWKEFIYTKKSLYIDNGIALRFNDRFYGALFSARLFDSPVISWGLGILGALTIIGGVFNNIEDEEK